MMRGEIVWSCVLVQHTDEHFGSRVVNVDRLEDGGAIVGDAHLLAAPQALQNLVLWFQACCIISSSRPSTTHHALGAECCLDHVGNGHGTHKRALWC